MGAEGALLSLSHYIDRRKRCSLQSWKLLARTATREERGYSLKRYDSTNVLVFRKYDVQQTLFVQSCMTSLSRDFVVQSFQKTAQCAVLYSSHCFGLFFFGVIR